MMKFEYEKQDKASECVAFIDFDGELMVKSASGGTIWFSYQGIVYEDHLKDWKEDTAVHRFYPGDSITITF